MQGSATEHAHAGHGRLLVYRSDATGAAPLADIEVGPHPAHVVVDRAGKRAFVTDSEENAVLVVDLERRALIARVPTGAYPHGLRMSPDGNEIYAAIPIRSGPTVARGLGSR
jgi:YVTN family beta-propeller protein